MPPLAINDFAQTTKAPRLSRVRLLRFLTGAFFAVTLAATLVAGLWPFTSPANDAKWADGENAIQFAENGTALSTGTLKMDAADACTIEVRLQRAAVWATGTPLAFYKPGDRRQVTLEQDFADLVLGVSANGDSAPTFRTLRVQDVFRRPEFLATITSNGKKTSVYIDGQLVLTSPNFGLSGRDLAGLVILGNSPGRDHSWSGKVSGLAIYDEELTPAKVQQHNQEWRQDDKSIAAGSDRLIALYLFKEHSGRVIHDSLSSGINLQIPEKFTTVDQVRFQSPTSEMHADGNYAEDIEINVAGFIPLGFISTLFFASLWGRRRGIIAAVPLAAAVSIAIEYFQSYLPTRYSGTTDIITNILGACLGAILGQVTVGLVAKKRIERSHAQSE